MEAPTDSDSMQVGPVAVGHADGVLTMPSEDFASLHLQPIQDDTWIRNAEIVHMENFVETEDGKRIKREILREYVEEKERQGTFHPDPILEGMIYQEKFMEAYRTNGRTVDADKAQSYRLKLLEKHRRARAIENADM
ncbi:hypothetical protein, conserved [Leishmania donovani]|uniref:Paraflagellar Rod Proteome Component 9, putative n=1 Tax=Leishmania donovani TaxID=5661 RepID=A0A3Q8IGZ2_LEIDO|nr:hypothetical protein, conserved [Leishmania donovani]AYU81723.1 Paraflagellar Rod Proteome Component 9, putative [Leishmania donovani]TPP43687.1 hypothetical protein CGC21_20430 [Leishmania donovani]CBZ36907.1 hypothetical protein, conserved [Leishmania donovani]